MPLFACRERLAKLPVPFKPMNESRDVNFKGDTQTIFGWLVIAGCTWYSLTESRLTAVSKYGEDIFAFIDFQMVDGPKLAININVGGEKSIEFPLFDVLLFATQVASTDTANLVVADLSVPPTSLTATEICFNQSGVDDPDVEFGDGTNNNGQEVVVPAVLTMFPKNNNRVRIHLNQPIAGYQDFELETQ